MDTQYRDFTPGTLCRFSGEYLRNTGQITGGEGPLRFYILSCSCGLCRAGHHVAVNIPSEYAQSGGYTPEEITAQPSLIWRHVAKASITIVGQADIRNTGDYGGFRKVLIGRPEDCRIASPKDPREPR